VPVPREIVVFISYENPGPPDLPETVGRELIAALNLGRAALGVDPLTGGCEVRFGYDPRVYEEARAWLAGRGVLHEIGTLG
jgi:hypothetical protein